MWNANRYKWMTGGILLLLFTLMFLLRVEPVTAESKESFDRLADQTWNTRHYYEVRPEGEVRGGILIYPDSGEDPVNYATLAERLAGEGLKTRVMKYPLGKAVLSQTELKEMDDNGGSAWITIGFGDGGKKACVLADRSPDITGLIILGDCQADVNLNDNDIRVTFFELAGHSISEEQKAKIIKRLPADTVFRTAESKEEITGKITQEIQETAVMQRMAVREAECDLVSEINRILARKGTGSKDR